MTRTEVGIELLQLGGLLGPAQRGERPQAGGEPGVQDVGVLASSPRRWAAPRRDRRRRPRRPGRTRPGCGGPTTAGARCTSRGGCRPSRSSAAPSPAGWIVTRPSRTASPAAWASGPTLTHHCMRQPRLDGRLAARAVADGVRCTAASRRRCGPRRAARRRSRSAPRTGRGPGRGRGTVMTRALVHDRDRLGRSCRWPISKSFGSWAGVTLTAPVPNSGSTWSSATTGIGAVGERQLDPLADEVRVPLVVGVDGDRGVAEHRLGAGGGDDDGVRRPRRTSCETSSPSSSWYSTSMSEIAVRQRGHQLMMRSAR